MVTLPKFKVKRPPRKFAERPGRWQNRSLGPAGPTRVNPRLDTYEVPVERMGQMVLDALIWIKNNVDSCVSAGLAEGFAALYEYRRYQHAGLHQEPRRNSRRCGRLPAAHRPVVDLVPDLNQLYSQLFDRALAQDRQPA